VGTWVALPSAKLVASGQRWSYAYSVDLINPKGVVTLMVENLDTDAERLGRAIQLRRVELGLKRPQLAKRAELSYPYLSEIENGMKSPSTKALRQLAAALELSPAELIVLAERLGGAHMHEATSVLVDHSRDELPNDPVVRLLAGPLPTGRNPTNSLMSVAPAPSLQIGGEGTLERRVQDLVAAVVRAELAAWARTELPGLVRAEIEHALAEREE
jgi:transcriptional regulator with XRE-family HTH domain